ncbi:putative transposase [Paenibacillus sp. PastF-3]|uniref:Mu transposase C-terminal domain-containing protein n=1 Tax=Paenibacillus sp. PastF-3 TaxID=2940626 RepID=UPI0024746935|nr:Mu transposase C-terminal domain-containing protein [Paenibacillus sp. PastF-3]MDH6374323.1 putative transposase [Paenibacillus sp. PastF-3]
MEGFSFVPGVQFLMNDQKYLVRKCIKNGELELSNLSYDNQIETYSMNELLLAWFEKRLIPKKENRSQMIHRMYDPNLLTEEERQIMEKRYKILKPVISGEIKPADFKIYVASLSDEMRKSIGSLASLYRWKKRYEITGDKRSLVSGERFKKRGYHTDPIVVSMIEKMLREEEKSGLQSTIREKWIEMKLQVKEYNEMRGDDQKIKPCSLTTVFRIVQDKTDSYGKDRSRHGAVQASLNKRGSTTEVDVERPLQRVEIDWTPIDLLIVDFKTLKRVRYYLIYAIDVFSDYPLGFYICPNEPDTKAIKQCLLHSMLPKVHLRKLYPQLKHDWTAFGVPEVIVLDNAKVNESKDLEEVCSLIGIEVQYCPVMTGHHKGTIERALKRVNHKIHQIPGTTFSNPQEKSQYNSAKNACVDLRTLFHIIHVIFIDLIANDYSIAVGGTPEFIWNQGLKNTVVHRKLPYKKDDLKLLLASGVDFRTITNKGVEIQSQFFQSPELMQLADRKKRKKDDQYVRVRFDMADMRTIYIYDEENQQYIEAYPTRNSLKKKKIDDQYPVHYEQLHAISYNNEQAYRGFDTSDMANANREINRLIEESKYRLKKLEQFPLEARAQIMAEDLATIQVAYDAQLAPSDLESLRLVDERIGHSQTKSDKFTKKKKSNDKKSSEEKKVYEIPTVNKEESQDYEIELEGYDTVFRQRIE